MKCKPIQGGGEYDHSMDIYVARNLLEIKDELREGDDVHEHKINSNLKIISS